MLMAITMVISESSKHEMLWWIQNLPHMFNVINHKNSSVYIYSDASNHAWGSYMCNKKQVVTGTNLKLTAILTSKRYWQ